MYRKGQSLERRLQKFLADCGLCSRRAAEQLIVQGRVSINGKAAELGSKVQDGDRVTVDGKPIREKRTRHTYIILNKPRGYITTMKDERDRACVADLLAKLSARVVPVGRLDRNSEGLLLLTDDGEMLYRLTHPNHEIEKRYLVTIRGEVSDEKLDALTGESALDGIPLKPVKVELLKRDAEKSVLRFTLTQGINRQIRRMCELADLEVLRLKRISEAGLTLSGVKSGRWRHLTEDEIALLRKVSGLEKGRIRG
jgi:23S rRNA pseudouridine2605 synthase